MVALSVAIVPASPVMAQTTRYVNPDGICGGNTPCYTTIQAAVDAAGSGDTIIVAAGTYNEDVTVSVANLILRGANEGKSAGANPETRGSESLIIGRITIQFNNVVIDGFRINSTGSSGIIINGGTIGHTISNNVVYGPGIGVSARGIEFSSNTSNIVVSDNEFTNWASGIYVNPSSNNNLQVTGNDFHDNFAGIGSDGLNNVSIEYNDFIGNTLEGFGCSNVGTNVQAHNNNFYLSNNAGINNYFSDYDTAQIIDATNNWWEHATGPYDGSDDRATGGWYNPLGQGVSVSDKVKYEPWQGQEEGEGGGGCFIATAAYGSYLDSHVETLRNFRDSYMVTNPVGSALVSAYYKLSPPVADFIDDHPALKPVVRVGLLPAVAMSTVAVNTTSAEKVAILGVILLVSALTVVWLRRKGVLLSRF